ncbi:hypothetical protein [Streptomyces sp. c-19]|uniref:hypothetical protein n=1 Tax=Streptomyces sp. c-19 TaxID=2789275 RepID=UPI00397FF304
MAGPDGTAVLETDRVVAATGCTPSLDRGGVLTAPSYGPSMRFVFGAGYTAPRLVRGVRRRLRSDARGGSVGRPRTGGTAPVPA